MTSNNKVPCNQGLDHEGGLRSKKQVSAVWVVLAVLGFVLCIAIIVPAIGHAPRATPEMVTSTYLRSIHQAMIVYAASNDGRYPPIETTFDILLEQGLIEPELLVSPLEDGDGTSYILVGLPETTFREDLIVLYEDPKHRKKGVTVVFDDNHTEVLSHQDFETRLANQTSQTTPP